MNFRYLIIGGLILTPLVLLVLPAGFFDTGRSLCLSKLFFDQECPGCGMTRGIMHLIHGNIDLALKYNKLSFVVLPLLLVLWVKEISRQIRIVRKTA